MKYVNGKLTGLVTFMRRNCLLQRVIEGKTRGGIEVTGRQGRRRRKLLDFFIDIILPASLWTWGRTSL